MDNSEIRSFLKDEIKPLWPKWSPSEPEIRIWAETFADVTEDELLDKIKIYYRDGGSKRQKPNIADLTAKHRRKRTTETWNADTEIYCECIEHERNPRLEGMRRGVFTPTSYDREKQMQAAEQERQRFEARTGGRWIVRTIKPPVDDGLRGPQAAARARELILSGPDSREKRFLLGDYRSNGNLFGDNSDLPF